MCKTCGCRSGNCLAGKCCHQYICCLCRTLFTKCYKSAAYLYCQKCMHLQKNILYNKLVQPTYTDSRLVVTYTIRVESHNGPCNDLRDMEYETVHVKFKFQIPKFFDMTNNKCLKNNVFKYLTLQNAFGKRTENCKGYCHSKTEHTISKIKVEHDWCTVTIYENTPLIIDSDSD